eukprot:GGOE01053543.1.p2 GENE.GGOE01053543.1~~GGOE01053543.1.p2  ORF type:complete len:223 (+),score=63.55 GGOE01053543.1:130-798(+)
MPSAAVRRPDLDDQSEGSIHFQEDSGHTDDQPVDAPQIDVVDPGEMTYDSILATSTSERRRTPFLWCSILCHFCCAALVTTLWLWLYLAKRDAACARPLQLWALVNALSPLCLLLLSFVNSALKSQDKQSYSAWLVLVSSVSCLVTVFYIVWFVIGNVWTYGMPDGECDGTLYLACFWFITGVYIVIGVSALFPCLQLVYAFCISNSRPKGESYAQQAQPLA